MSGWDWSRGYDAGYADAVAVFRRGLSNPDALLPGRVQRDGEHTSRQAALAWPARRASQRRHVIEVLEKAGRRGLTDDQIVAAYHTERQNLRTRRKELTDGGWVEEHPNGHVRMTRSGQDAKIWVLSELGLAQLRAESGA